MSAIASPLRSTQVRALIWKETRQLWPLVGVLLAMGVTLEILWSLMPIGVHSQQFFASVIPILLPALYCVGAPSVLVSQEHELRTIDWLISLPLEPRRLIGAKLGVALGGLVAMWIVCGIILLCQSKFTGVASWNWLPTGVVSHPSNPLGDGLFVLLHSLFVLLCAFYTTWRIRNPLVSLIAVLPLAMLPTMITLLVYELYERTTGRGFVHPAAATVWSHGVLATACLGLYWLGRAAALAALHPQQSAIAKNQNSSLAKSSVRSGARSLAPFRFSISTVCWQMIHQNRWGFAAIASLITTGAICMLLVTGHQSPPNRWDLSAGMIAGPLGVAWLGVYVFSGDGTPQKLRFLADRGVSPTVVWLGRHLIGIAVLSTIAATCLLQHHPADPHSMHFVLSLAFIALLLASIYSAAQWTAQICQLMAVSFVLAPPLAGAFVFWLGYSAGNLAAPLWIVLLMIGLPMLATWISMRDYMDSRRSWFRWSIAGLTLLLIIGLPCLPLAARYWSLPGLDRQQVVQWSQEAERIARATPVATGIVVDATAVDTVDIEQPGLLDPHWMNDAMGKANLQWLAVQSRPDDEATIGQLEQWMEALSIAAHRLRLNPRLVSAQQADGIEIWLARVVDSPVLREHRDRPLIASVQKRLDDDDFRNHSRRQAVLSTWHATTRAAATFDPGFASEEFKMIAWNHMYSDIARLMLTRRRIDAVCSALIEMIDAGSRGESTEPMRRQLHRLVIGNSLDFRNGPYSERFRAPSQNHSISLSIDNSLLNYPGSQWYAGWEQSQ
ncbi:ABC-2 family transporter protein [Rosistilla carotiformis]|uniref:ABC-2 family transporter protein n=1 Tax=Rosistilla carotiformis TaxID=2528017 RepID=A0A518JRL7_9BACT|nr:hypothetical protein [Rosistilla carotiformis]QDV68165.1 ABC-2 family transporter protein [Rosistilla carotiformis]